MGRKFKAHDERKNEILDATWELITHHGYEKATVAAIIKRLDISKGTFYHYFTSKEQVLNGIADRLSEESLEELRKVVDDPNLEARPKLNLFFETARRSRLRRIDSIIDVARVLYREENLIVRHKINERLFEISIPALRSIVEQGIKEGCFQVTDAEETARFIWHLSNTFADQQMQTLLSSLPVDQKVPKMVRRANFVVDSFERILGAKPGTIEKPHPKILELFARAIEEHDAENSSESVQKT